MKTTMPNTVLVVDDNEANRLLVQDTLQDEDYEVVMCEGGEEALSLFAKHTPDCVLLDVRMPGIDGIATCERIRALPAGQGTPIIFLTALRDVDTFERAIAAGGDDFLTKPLQPAELLGRVQTALKVRRMSAELHEQYEQLKRQRDDLMRMHLQKERLMAFVVHDLKNPVNSMDLQAQVLLLEPDLPSGAREAAGQIRAEAAVMGRMLANLLDLSRSDEGKLTPKLSRIDLRVAVDSILAELGADATRHGIALRGAVNVQSVTADKDLLRRILGNLIDNALRHAPSGSVVSVTAEEREEEIELRVTDSGPGVPTYMRESIFEAFVQVDGDRLRALGGRGLGLTFCRLAVLAHHGRIWVEDAAPGAAFCVRLPRV
jgi:signal transduction histidine kinase